MTGRGGLVRRQVTGRGQVEIEQQIVAAGVRVGNVAQHVVTPWRRGGGATRERRHGERGQKEAGDAQGNKGNGKSASADGVDGFPV